MLPAPVHPIFRSNLPIALQIAFVPRDEANRQDLVLLQPVLALHVNHLREVLECLERAGLRDVIDQQESVTFEVRLRPEAAVFLLPSSVREPERICRAVDRSRHRVGVLDRRVVPGKFDVSIPWPESCARARSITTYSCVHWLRTKRSVIEDFPQPPSPHTVIVTRCESSMVTGVFQQGVESSNRARSRIQKIPPSSSQTLNLLYFLPPRNHTTAASGHRCDQAATDNMAV